MKKLLCVLLVMTIALSFAACGKEKQSKVTIYIPETMTISDPTGAVMVTINLVFEEGWETKESFQVTYSGDTEILGENVPTITYNGKTVITDMAGVSRSEAICDDNGRQISQTIYYLSENATMEKMETSVTYDAHGRRLTQVIKSYYSGNAEPVIQTQTYTYEDTETGSKGTWNDGDITYVIEYDKDYRFVAQATVMNGQEMSRSETEYDANGNQISTVSYYSGQKNMETKYTYKAVEVSAETAARLPQFKQGK